MSGVWETLVKGNNVWKFCAAGALFPVTAALYNLKFQADIRNKDYFIKAMAMLSAYQPAVDHLGSPIKGKSIQRGIGSKNSFLKDRVDLHIPVQGPKDEGVLKVQAYLKDERWQIEQLDISLSSTSKSWMFYKQQSEMDIK